MSTIRKKQILNALKFQTLKTQNFVAGKWVYSNIVREQTDIYPFIFWPAG